MRSTLRSAALALAATVPIALHCASLAPLQAPCSIAPSEEPGKISLHINDVDCPTGHHCGSNFSSELLDRFTGFTLADLGREGAHLTATLTAEAGTFTCSGTVHDHELVGESTFTPDNGFVSRMEQMGFSGFDSEKLRAYTFVNVDTAFVRSLQQIHISGINIDNLIALRIFKVDPEYVHTITSLGYKQPDADQLIGLRVQGVNGEEVRQLRAMGYQPTLDELIQIRIFKITPDFIHRMQARGFHDLTIAKLVQIRIFKLAD